MSAAPAIGLIAGAGRLPVELARGARRSGLAVHAIGLRALAEPALGEAASSCEWLYLGELERLFASLRAAGAQQVVLAGKVPKTLLLHAGAPVRPDARARALLAALPDRSDDSLLGALARALAQEGYGLRSQLELVPGLVASAGTWSAREPSAEEWSDIRFGWPIARALGAVDVGQTVVVQGRAVLALEAIEGTDAAIERGLQLSARGRPACVVKLAKPAQDPRFDVPTIGLGTLRAIAAGGGSALAIEAGRTLALDRAELPAFADSHGIALVALAEPGA